MRSLRKTRRLLLSLLSRMVGRKQLTDEERDKRIRERHQAYYQQHKEKLIETSRQHRLKNKEKYDEYHRKYYEEHKTDEHRMNQLLLSARKYKEKNRAEINAAARAKRAEQKAAAEAAAAEKAAKGIIEVPVEGTITVVRGGVTLGKDAWA